MPSLSTLHLPIRRSFDLLRLTISIANSFKHLHDINHENTSVKLKFILWRSVGRSPASSKCSVVNYLARCAKINCRLETITTSRIKCNSAKVDVLLLIKFRHKQKVLHHKSRCEITLSTPAQSCKSDAPGFNLFYQIQTLYSRLQPGSPYAGKLKPSTPFHPA